MWSGILSSLQQPYTNMQQSHPDTTPLPVKKQYRPLKMGTNSFHASLPASRPPTFTCFPKLPCELQLMVWEFALPHRTVYIDVHDVLRSRLCQPPHFPPSISRACRDAHTIATKTGRWLWVGRASDMQQLQRTDRENVSGITTTTTTMCTHPIRNLRKNILWFDIARDTLLTSNLLLWPQDTKANPVAVEIPVGDVTVTRSLYFDILAEVVPRIWHLDLSKSQLLHFRMLPPPLEELVFQSDKTPPKSPVDLRLWPGYATTTTPTTMPTTATPTPNPAAAAAAEIAYADCDLTIAITRPLAPKAHAEFFPEGSTVCFIDLTALEQLLPSWSSSCSLSSSPLLSSYSSPQTTSEPPTQTREKLGRLWHAYASTQDFGRGGSTEAGTARGRTDLDAWRFLEDLWVDPAKRSGVFESKRRALAFKWLRLNWMKLTRSERREFGVRGAARCVCCADAFPPTAPPSWSAAPSPTFSPTPGSPPSPPLTPPSPSSPSSLSSSSSSSSLSSSSWFPESSSAAAEPSVVYRMPRPHAAAFSCPRQFNIEHPWTRRILENMPRFKFGLLVRLDGEAAVAAGGTASGPLPGRRIPGRDVVVRVPPG